MLRFSLDRPLPSSGEVLPVLSLPARVTMRDVSSGNHSLNVNTVSGKDRGSVLGEKDSAYEKVIELCRSVHATCVRQIPLAHTTLAHTDESTSTQNSAADTATTTATPITTTTTTTTTITAKDNTFSAYALESPGYLGIAGKVWDSMYVLLQYLAIHQEELVRDKRIVELGCGTGLAGEFYFFHF